MPPNFNVYSFFTNLTFLFHERDTLAKIVELWYIVAKLYWR